MKQKDIIQIFPSMRKNNRTVRVLKEPKTDSSIRKVYIPSSVAILLAELREEQNETIEALGDMYENYNLVMATSYGLPLGESYLRVKMQEVIDREGLPDVVFHSLRHTSVTYKLKLSGGDIKAVQGDSGHAQADMVTEVYGHILDEDRSLFTVRLDLRRNDRRRFAFYQRDGSGQTFPFLLGNECQVIENVDQVNSPKRILGRFAGN